MKLFLILTILVTACWGQSQLPAAGSNTNFGSVTMGGGFNLANQSLLQSATNCASGTVTAKLVKWNSAAGVPCLTVVATTDTNTAIGICVNACGNSGTAQYASLGVAASCVFDGATTVNDFVIISPTVTGDCHDSGSATVNPTTTEVIGRVQSTNGGGGTYGVNVGASLDIVGGGGSGNVPAMSSATQGATLTNNASVAKWSRQVFDVAAGYGADPTGVADSASAIASAITACGSAGGGAILFPAGTYIHNSQILLNQDNCYLVANNRSATLKKNYNSTIGTPGANGSLLISGSNTGIIGLIYDGNQAGAKTGACITDATNNTDVLIQNVKIFGCDGPPLVFTASAGGGTGVTRASVLDSYIVAGTGTNDNYGAIGFQETINTVNISRNILDCINNTSGVGVGCIQAESQGLTTNFSGITVDNNYIICPTSDGTHSAWCVQWGNFNSYATVDSKLTNNYMIQKAANPGGCASTVSWLGGVIAGNVCDYNGQTGVYTGYELIYSTGVSFTGNTCLGENTGSNACLVVHGTNYSSITGNTFLGWGESTTGGTTAGITMNGDAAQTLTAASETGLIATFTTSGTLSAFIQPGGSIVISGVTPSGYNGGPYTILNTNYVRSAGTFSVALPTSGLGAGSVFGAVDSSASSNTITGNTLTFPSGSLGALTGPLYGIQLRCAASGSVCSNNRIADNTINGSGSAQSATEYAISLQSAATADSDTFTNNTFVNLNHGYNITSGTNTVIGPTQFISVTTPLTITVNGTINASAIPITFARLTTCAAGLEGNTAVVTDNNASPAWDATITGSGSGHVRGYCDATNWVMQ